MLECGEQWASSPVVKRRCIYSWCGLQKLNRRHPCPSCASPKSHAKTASARHRNTARIARTAACERWTGQGSCPCATPALLCTRSRRRQCHGSIFSCRQERLPRPPSFLPRSAHPYVAAASLCLLVVRLGRNNQTHAAPSVR